MSEHDLNELRSLFAAMTDGSITVEQMALLEAKLSASAEARRLWFLHCDIETGLADWAAARSEKCTNLPLPVTKGVHQKSSTIRRRLALLTATLAVVTLVTLWWSGQFERVSTGTETPTSSIAMLARASDVEWIDGTELRAGSALAPGSLHLKSGAVQVEFYSGARVIVEGPAEFELISSGEGSLRSGRISAHVPPLARGFTIHTPGAKIVDYGTDFGVSIKGDAPPEVHVFTGRVEVVTPKAAPRSLTQGQAVRFDAGMPQNIPAQRSKFLSEEELARRDDTAAQQRLVRWSASAGALSKDAACVLHYTFEETEPLARLIKNRNANALPESNGSVVGGVWSQGRWQGRRALEFRGEGDRIRFDAPSPGQAITLIAWVRVDALPRRQNVLMAADSEVTGSLHWHLMEHGELRLEIARDLGRTHADWEAVNSAPFVTTARLGQWLLLVTTFDGKDIRHYGNGEPIGSGASFAPPALHIGTAELGNWRGSTQRQFAGSMDEFAILGRAMSDAEVRALYKAGI